MRRRSCCWAEWCASCWLSASSSTVCFFSTTNCTTDAHKHTHMRTNTQTSTQTILLVIYVLFQYHEYQDMIHTNTGTHSNTCTHTHTHTHTHIQSHTHTRACMHACRQEDVCFLEKMNKCKTVLTLLLQHSIALIVRRKYILQPKTQRQLWNW